MPAKIRVLVIDDSVVFRSQIRAALERSPLVEVVGVANNGKIAPQKLEQSSVDLVTLDMEMPEMGGLETIREMKRKNFKSRILVFSSKTTRCSQETLDALALGADDFVTKPDLTSSALTAAADAIAAELIPKVLQFVSPDGAMEPVTAQPTKAASSSPVAAVASVVKKDLRTFQPSVLVIGSSTGGPQALDKLFKDTPGPYRIPILIAQHMPPVFTASLAKRIQGVAGVEAAEGVDMEELKPNRIYIAPGDFHMSLGHLGNKTRIVLDKNPPRNSVRPSVDVLFEGAAKIFGPRALGLVLTGMGEDGLVGARAIKSAGGGILIQNKESCTVFGMPGAIFKTGIHDEMGDLFSINRIIKRMLS